MSTSAAYRSILKQVRPPNEAPRHLSEAVNYPRFKRPYPRTDVISYLFYFILLTFLFYFPKTIAKLDMYNFVVHKFLRFMLIDYSDF